MLIWFVIVAVILSMYTLKKKLRHNKSNAGSYILEAANLKCQHSFLWLPTILKVYIIGILETLTIVLYKRTSFYKENENIDHSINYKKSNPTAVITGGDSGIGLELVNRLLEAQFHVIIGTRSRDLCSKAIEPYMVGMGRVTILELDLTSFDSVHTFAFKVVLEASEKIDLLINNAGVMNVPYSKTADGFESQCQINYLSPILLTQLLLPSMNPRGSRILFASSSTLYAINNLDTNMPFRSYTHNGLDHYAYSKSCIAHLAQHLSTIVPPDIKVYSYHPGTVRTKLFDHTTLFTFKLFSKLFDFIMLTPKEGSKTPLHLCLCEYLENGSSYWADNRPQTLMPVYVDNKLNDIRQLWEDTLIKVRINQSRSE